MKLTGIKIDSRLFHLNTAYLFLKTRRLFMKIRQLLRKIRRLFKVLLPDLLDWDYRRCKRVS